MTSRTVVLVAGVDVLLEEVDVHRAQDDGCRHELRQRTIVAVLVRTKGASDVPKPWPRRVMNQSLERLPGRRRPARRRACPCTIASVLIDRRAAVEPRPTRPLVVRGPACVCSLLAHERRWTDTWRTQNRNPPTQTPKGNGPESPPGRSISYQPILVRRSAEQARPLQKPCLIALVSRRRRPAPTTSKRTTGIREAGRARPRSRPEAWPHRPARGERHRPRTQANAPPEFAKQDARGQGAAPNPGLIGQRGASDTGPAHKQTHHRNSRSRTCAAKEPPRSLAS